jgi:two-component system KDP operon response regulator KdpE
MKILVVEDDPIVIEVISVALRMRWPDAKVIAVSQGEEGLRLVETEFPDAVIIDLGLPDISGFEVLKGIRLFSNVPVLIVSGRNEETEIVKGLEWGADDYMTKPFKQLELLARVNGMMKRNEQQNQESLVCGQLRFEPASLRVWSGQKEIKISPTEGLILAHLMRNAGNVVNYDSLSHKMWGDNFPEAHDSIKVHIRHLREKLEENPSRPQIILTQQGIGYFMAKR